MKERPARRTRWKSVRLSVRVLMFLKLVSGDWLGELVQRAHIHCDAVAVVARAGAFGPAFDLAVALRITTRPAR